MSASKARELQAAVNAALGKKGGAAVVRMASDPEFRTEFVPTGLLPMDILLGGGIPIGRFIEIFGDWSTLKSYIGYNACAQFQQRGGVAAVIDTEHSFDADWAEQCGVNVDELIVERPTSGELAIDIMETLIRGGVDFILVDSISSLLPEAEQKKRLHDESLQPARLAMLMSAGLRRLTAANGKTSVMWINQTRVNIGITFGSNESTTGGKSMPFYASLRVRITKAGHVTRPVKSFNGEKWTDTKEKIGQRFRAEVVKSKLSKPFRDIMFDWNLIDGQIDLLTFLISQGVESGIITIAGNSWTYRSLKVVGREKFRDTLATKPDLINGLEDEVRAHHGLKPMHTVPVSKKKPTKSLRKK